MQLKSALAGLLLVLVAPPAWGWGCKGHQLVALLAERHLREDVRRQVAELIGSPDTVIDVTRACTARGLPPLAEVSTWADDVRHAPSPRGRPETAPWHFIDIPRGVSRGPIKPFCPTAGCVVSAIESRRRVLADRHLRPRVRAEALMYLVHFVADIHQPLHCATNRDRGGNCVPVDYFGRQTRLDRRGGSGTWSPNLHQVWDSDILDRAIGRTGLEAYARRLDREFADRFDSWAQGAAEDWAWETHQVADTVAYGQLPTRLPIEPGDVRGCDDGGASRYWRRYHERLGDSYQRLAAATVDRQLAKAAARLVLLLDRALSPGTASPGRP